jgi:hypothetical protein
VGIYPISGQSIAISTGAWSAGVYYLTMVKQDGQVSTTKQLIRH